ncbi:beta-catenin-interacting protein 1-like [Arapaima gigas]
MTNFVRKSSIRYRSGASVLLKRLTEQRDAAARNPGTSVSCGVQRSGAGEGGRSARGPPPADSFTHIHDRVFEVDRSWEMEREGTPAKAPEEMYIQQKVRVLLMLRNMGSNLTPNEEAFLQMHATVVQNQMSQLPQHSVEQGAEDGITAFTSSEAEEPRE